jgi:hypothetical protein
MPTIFTDKKSPVPAPMSKMLPLFGCNELIKFNLFFKRNAFTK